MQQEHIIREKDATRRGVEEEVRRVI